MGSSWGVNQRTLGDGATDPGAGVAGGWTEWGSGEGLREMGGSLFTEGVEGAVGGAEGGCWGAEREGQIGNLKGKAYPGKIRVYS